MRLTADIKKQMADKAVEKSGLREELKKLEGAARDAADRLRVYLLGGAERAEMVEKLDDGQRYPVVTKSSTFYVAVGGRHIWFTLPSRRAVPSKDAHIDGGVQEGIDAMAAYEAEQQKRAEIRDLRKDVMQNLSKFTTDSQLLKVWPEAAELLPEKPAKKQLPAIRTDDLNARIKLPSGPKA